MSLQRQITALSPIGYWPMSSLDVSGTTVFDRSGNGRDMTSGGSPAFNRTFCDGRGYMDFSGGGAGSYCAIADSSVWSPQVGGSGAITLMCFAMRDANFGTSTWLFGKGTGGQYEWDMRVETTGFLDSSVFNLSGSGGDSVSMSSVWPLSTWSHFAMTWSKPGNSCQLYYNGAVVATTTASITPGDGSAPLYLGTRADQPSVRLDGAMAHAAIFGAALTADQVMTVYKAGLRSSVVTG